MKYTRAGQSRYANYRMQNPGVANFIAPEGKADFMIDQLDPDAIREGFGAVARGARSLYDQGAYQLAKNTDIGEVPGMVGRALQGGQDLAGQAWQGVKGLAGQGQDLAGQAGQAGQQVIQNMKGAVDPRVAQGAQIAAEVGGAGAAGVVGAGYLAKATKGLRKAKTAAGVVEDAGEAAPGIIAKARQAISNAPMAAKVGAGVGVAGLAGGGAYMANRRRMDEEAAYSRPSLAEAKFMYSRKEN